MPIENRLQIPENKAPSEALASSNDSKAKARITNRHTIQVEYTAIPVERERSYARAERETPSTNVQTDVAQLGRKGTTGSQQMSAPISKPTPYSNTIDNHVVPSVVDPDKTAHGFSELPEASKAAQDQAKDLVVNIPTDRQLLSCATPLHESLANDLDVKIPTENSPGRINAPRPPISAANQQSLDARMIPRLE